LLSATVIRTAIAVACLSAGAGSALVSQAKAANHPCNVVQNERACYLGYEFIQDSWRKYRTGLSMLHGVEAFCGRRYQRHSDNWQSCQIGGALHMIGKDIPLE
jgi:hypothetical protein